MSKARELAQKPNQPTGRKNLIINGAMQVAQRGSMTISGDTYTTCDRFRYDKGGSYNASFSITQDSDAPEGFSNSLKLDCTVADPIASDEHSNLRYRIEAQDIQHLLYGTSNAKKTTLSFWVKSNETATFSVALYQDDGVRVVGSTYTINAADTWEYKTITFAGDTGGTINNDNGTGLQFIFGLNAGSSFTGTDNTSWGAYSGGKFAYGHTANIGSSTSDYFQITGVQLEVGSVATEFEHRSFGEELALCQRYYQVVDFGNSYGPFDGYFGAGNYLHYTSSRTVTMRTDPSATITYSTTLNLQTNPGIHTSDNAENIRIVARATNTGRAYAIFNKYTADAEL